MVEYLRSGQPPHTAGWVAVFQATDAEIEADWVAVRDEVLDDWIRRYPGTRPWGWWRFDAPRWPREHWPGRMEDYGDWADDTWAEPRRRVGGIGTPQHEVLNVSPSFDRGIPQSWVTRWEADFYNGRARDIHGEPIGRGYRSNFAGIGFDPNDPPRFESEASYLQRHGLLKPDERRRLPADAFDPERVDADDAV